MIDYTITIGNIVEIGTIMSGGVWFLIKSGSKLTNLTSDMAYVKDKVKSINDLVTSKALIEKDIERLKEDVRELRHGDGFVRNRLPGAPGVNKEYSG